MSLSLLTVLSLALSQVLGGKSNDCGHVGPYPLNECTSNDDNYSWKITCDNNQYDVLFYDSNGCSGTGIATTSDGQEITTDFWDTLCAPDGACSCSEDSCDSFSWTVSETCSWDSSSTNTYSYSSSVILDVCIPAYFGDYDSTTDMPYVTWDCNPSFDPDEDWSDEYYYDLDIDMVPVIPTYYTDSDCTEEYDWDGDATTSTSGTSTSSNECTWDYDNDCEYQISDDLGDCSFYQHFPINQCMHYANDYNYYYAYAVGGDSSMSTSTTTTTTEEELSVQYTCTNDGSNIVYYFNSYSDDGCTDLINAEDVTSLCTDDPTLCNCNAVTAGSGDSNSCNIMQIGEAYTCTVDTSNDWSRYTLYVTENCIGNAQYECYDGYGPDEFDYQKRVYDDSTCTDATYDRCGPFFDAVCDYNNAVDTTNCGYISDPNSMIDYSAESMLILDVCYSYSYTDDSYTDATGWNYNCTDDELGNADSIQFYKNWWNSTDCSGDILTWNEVDCSSDGVTCQCGDGTACAVTQLTTGYSCDGTNAYSDTEVNYFLTAGDCIADTTSGGSETGLYAQYSCADNTLDKVVFNDNSCADENSECSRYGYSDYDYSNGGGNDYSYSCTEKSNGAKCGYYADSIPLSTCYSGSSSYSSSYSYKYECDSDVYTQYAYETYDCSGDPTYTYDVSYNCDDTSGYYDCSCQSNSECGVWTSEYTDSCYGDESFYSVVIGECVSYPYCQDSDGNYEDCWMIRTCEGDWYDTAYYSDEECTTERSYSSSNYGCEFQLTYDDDDAKLCKQEWSGVYRYNSNLIVLGTLFIFGLIH